MATAEPKVTKLAPGEGAAETKKEARKGLRGQSLKTKCIQSDGSVNPECKEIYQRSVAGREKLEDYVKRLDSSGASEKDVFMAAVKSLTERRHGYVGAYLDEKNPDRRYEKNEAMAVADSVMSKAGVGENPGARLTEESDDQKKARSEKREASKEPGAVPEPGPRAMSVRQQRKQPGGRGPGLGPVPGQEGKQVEEKKAPPSPVQKLVEDIKNMSPEEKKKYFEDRLEKAKTQKARAGMGIGTPALPGSKAAAIRDASIEEQKKIEGEAQEKRQAGAQQAREVAKKKKEAGGGMQSQVAKELQKGGLGGKLETSKEDWLDDDDDDDLAPGVEDKEVETPERSAQKSQAFEKLTKLSGNLKNEFPNQLDLLARRELKFPHSMDKKIQPRLVGQGQQQQLDKKKQEILSNPELLQKAVDGAVYQVATENDIFDDSDFDSLSTDFLNNWLKRQREQKPQQTASTPRDTPSAKPAPRSSGLTPEEEAKWLPKGARKPAQEIQGPKTTTEQPQPPAEQATPPAPEQTRKPTPRQAMAQRTEELNSRAQQLVQENPEMDITEAKISAATQMNLEKRKSGVRNKSKKEPGLLSQLAKGTLDSFAKAVLNGIERHNRATQALAKKPTAEPPQKTSQGPSAEPKQMSDEEKLKEVTRLVKEEGMGLGAARKQVGVKPRPARRAKQKGKTSDSSEYQEFSDAVRQVVKLRSAQLVKSH
jgi:hypothetical protein